MTDLLKEALYMLIFGCPSPGYVKIIERRERERKSKEKGVIGFKTNNIEF